MQIFNLNPAPAKTNRSGSISKDSGVPVQLSKPSPYPLKELEFYEFFRYVKSRVSATTFQAILVGAGRSCGRLSKSECNIC